jgi:regulatory protein spx
VWLEQNKVEFSYHNLLKEQLSLKDLKKLAGINKLTVKDLINRRSQVFKKMDIDFDSLDEEAAADLISNNPRILIRPLLTDGKKLILGFKEVEYQQLLTD